MYICAVKQIAADRSKGSKARWVIVQQIRMKQNGNKSQGSEKQEHRTSSDRKGRDAVEKADG